MRVINKHTEFKSCDIVKCVDAEAYEHLLTVGDIYELENASGRYVGLKGSSCKIVFCEDRFVLATAEEALQYKVNVAKKQLEEAEDALEELKNIRIGDKVVWMKADGVSFVANEIYTVKSFLWRGFTRYITVEGVEDIGCKDYFRKATQIEIDEYLAELEYKKPLIHPSDPVPELNDAIETLKLLMQQEGSVVGYGSHGIVEIYYSEVNERVTFSPSTHHTPFPTFKTCDFANAAIKNIGEERLIKMFKSFAGINI